MRESLHQVWNLLWLKIQQPVLVSEVEQVNLEVRNQITNGVHIPVVKNILHNVNQIRIVIKEKL
jgi:hypothetical protein